jgi:hypothetical protein
VKELSVNGPYRGCRVGAQILIDLCSSLYSGARKLQNLALWINTQAMRIINNAAIVILIAPN